MKITPTDTNRLQELFDLSGTTGEPLEISGIFTIQTQLKTNGATILGSIRSHHGDWNIGGSVFHFKNSENLKTGCIRVTQNPKTFKATYIENMAFVAYHQSTPEYPCMVMDANSVGSVVDNVIIDRAGIGILFEPSDPTLIRSIGHRFNNISIKSFRTAGIKCIEPSKTTDHIFTGMIYLTGKQHNDYINNPPTTNYIPIGIDGLPASSSFDYLLIESCGTMIKTKNLINVRIKDLFMDDCLGICIDRGQTYTGALYDKTLSIGILTASSSVPKCIKFTGNRNQMISIGLEKYTICKVGASWK